MMKPDDQPDISWWYPDFDPVRSAHHQVSANVAFEPLPAKIGQMMRERFQCGLREVGFVRQPAFPNPSSISAEEHLLRGAYQTGVANRNGGKATSIEDAACGCCGSKHLFRALLRINVASRRAVHWESLQFPDLARIMIGALAEARVASLMAEASLEVYATTICEDLNLGIDLLVPFAGMSRGLAVQVKSVRDTCSPFLVLLDPAEAVQIKSSEPWHKLMLEKVGGFNASVQTDYRAIVANVGPDGDDRFNFYEPEKIEFIQTFIRKISTQQPTDQT